MKKVSRREAQRVRATPLHQDRGRPGAINAPNPATPPEKSPINPLSRLSGVGLGNGAIAAASGSPSDRSPALK
jgi:hypothetical protein